jgi:hypothetical protein
MKFLCPYREPQRRLKGNLHTHTTRSGCSVSLEDAIDRCRYDGRIAWANPFFIEQ